MLNENLQIGDLVSWKTHPTALMGVVISKDKVKLNGVDECSLIRVAFTSSQTYWLPDNKVQKVG